MTLTFSDFAKLLYPLCSMGGSKAEFVITLTDHFMPKPGAVIGDKYINPMRNKGKRSLLQYYNGDNNRGIPKKDATVIIGHSNKYRFSEYIRGFPDDVKNKIVDRLIENGVSSVKELNVEEKCADIFEAILISGKYEEI